MGSGFRKAGAARLRNWAQRVTAVSEQVLSVLKELGCTIQEDHDINVSHINIDHVNSSDFNICRPMRPFVCTYVS